MTRKPNLFIIGAAKSGTTSLHDYLARHPDVFLSDPKEPGFFTPEVGYYPTDEAWYLGLFDGAGSARYRGESSTHYTKLPVHAGVPRRIAAFVDEPPRFVYLMRDPVARAISHYWHNVRKQQEHRPFARAMREVADYRAFSDYPMQLAPYFETFGRASVYTLTFEELTSRPAAELRALLEWLELPPIEAAVALEKRNARPASVQKVRGRGYLQRFAHSALWDRVSPMAPRWLKRLGNRMSLEAVDTAARLPEDVVEELRAELQPSVAELSRLLGRGFPGWKLGAGALGPDAPGS